MSARTFEDAFEIEADGDAFRARLEGFGGYTLGCATLAIAQGMDDYALHAVHTCFVRPVPTDTASRLEPIDLSRGRRFARRRLSISSHGKLCVDLLASFAAPSDGPDFEDPVALEVPAPEELPSDREVARTEGWEWDDDFERVIEMRWCGRPWALETSAADSRYQAWVRPCAPPRSAAGRAAGIAFTSDYHSHWPVARKLGGPFDTTGFTSLDQSVWIHREDPWDDWWLFTSWTDQGHAGRSLGHRTLRTRSGRLVASMAQEAMIPGARPKG